MERTKRSRTKADAAKSGNTRKKFLMVRLRRDEMERLRAAAQRDGYEEVSPWVRSILNRICDGAKLAAA